MRRAALVLCSLASALVLPVRAVAAPDCVGAPQPRTLLSGQGVMESAIVDSQGRLFYSATPTGGSGELLRMDGPASTPQVLVRGVSNPGGLAFDGSGSLLFGFGNGFVNGALGNLL